MEIVFATNNLHKLEEANFIAKDSGLTFLLPSENFNPIETGATFAENSYIKAYEAAKLTGKMTLADDSGLCVDALGGAPGIHSARYAETQAKRIEKLLKELAPFKNKTAKFVCCMTLVNNEGKIIHQVTGECHGEITANSKGQNGFGYDPIFVPVDYNKTLAELSEAEKNSISHRGNALREMLKFISTL